MSRTRFLWFKKACKDLWKRKSVSIPIIIIIFAAMVVGFWLIQMGLNIQKTQTQFHEETNAGDIWFYTKPFTKSEFNQSVIDEWNATSKVEAITIRVRAEGNFILNEEKLKADIIGLPHDSRAEVNDIITTNDIYFSDNSSLTHGVFIGNAHFEYYNLEVGTNISFELPIANNMTTVNGFILGTHFSPEYPFAKNDLMDINFLGGETMGKFDIFARNDFLQNLLFEGEDKYNQICIKLKDSSESKPFISLVKQSDFGIKYVGGITEVPFLVRGIGRLYVLFGIGFSFTIFALTIFFTYIIINRFIEEQKQQIGVLKSLGYDNKTVIASFLNYGVIFGLIGGVPGLVLGWLSGKYTALGLSTFMYSYPYHLNDFIPWMYIVALIVTLLIAIFAIYLPARKTTKISPQEAIRPTIEYESASKSKIEKLMVKVFPKRKISPLSKYYLRYISKKPKRTLSTIFIVTSAVLIISLTFTCVNMMGGGADVIADEVQWDLQIQPVGTMNYQQLETLIQNKTSATDVLFEPTFSDYASIEINQLLNHLQFTGIDLETKMFRLEGNSLINTTAAIVTPWIARDLDLEKGSTYRIVGRNGTYYEVFIQEILKERTIPNFYISMELAMILSFGDSSIVYANSIYVKSENYSHIEELKTSLKNEPYINRIIEVTDLFESADELQKLWNLMMIPFIIMFILFGAVMIFGIIIIGVSERKNDFMIIKALGYKNNQIYNNAIMETVILSIIAGIIGHFLGMLVSSIYMRYIISYFFTDWPVASMKFSWVHFVISLIFVFITTMLGQFMALRQTLNQKIAKVTKEKLFA